MGLIVKDDRWRIPDSLWGKMELLLPPRKPHPLGCHNPRVPDRDAIDAILFVLRTGCQWNALDATGICSCSSAYRRFREWSKAGIFDVFPQKGPSKYDKIKGIEWKWQSMDSAMAKAPLGGEKTGRNPTDRGKSGTKRSVLTEGKGILIAATVDGANRYDKGYDFDEVRELVKEFGYTAHIRARGEEARELKKKAGMKAQRWVAERVHNWLNRFRRILVRWEKRADTFFAMLHLACGIITWRATSLLK